MGCSKSIHDTVTSSRQELGVVADDKRGGGRIEGGKDKGGNACGLHLPRSTEGRKEELIGWKGWKGRLGVLMGGGV